MKLTRNHGDKILANKTRHRISCEKTPSEIFQIFLWQKLLPPDIVGENKFENRH